MDRILLRTTGLGNALQRRTRDSQQMDRILLRTIGRATMRSWVRIGDNFRGSGLQSAPRRSLPRINNRSFVRKHEIAVAILKKGEESDTGVDNIPAELAVQLGGETMIDVLTDICNRIWRTGEWPTPWTQSLIITLPKKGNLQLCQNYRTISLISHSSKVMLKVILNRLKLQAEEIITEQQAGFRAGMGTTEQIFNLRILCEKYCPTSAESVPCLHWFQKSFWQGMACSLMGHPAEVQYQCKSSLHHRDSYTTRLQVQSWWMAAQENGSEQQLE